METWEIWSSIAVVSLLTESVVDRSWLLVLAAASAITALLAAVSSTGLWLQSGVVVGLMWAGMEWHWHKVASLQALVAVSPFDIGDAVHVLYWKDATHARVRYRGSEWAAELISDMEQKRAAKYFIVGTQGAILLLSSNKPPITTAGVA